MITLDLLELDRIFNRHGFSIRLVGGCVRDYLLGMVPHDIDIATDASPDEQLAIYQQSDVRHFDTGLKHGTRTVILHDVPYEVTSLRRDVLTDGRHATVEYVRDWEIDSNRRDFTMNALYMDCEEKIYDYHNGVDDLKAGIVRFVGNAEDRIREDYLRILRYYRFYGRFGLGFMSAEDEQALFENADGLKQLSAERVWSELKKILVLPKADIVLRIMHDNRVFDVLDMQVDINAYAGHKFKPETNLAMMCYNFADVARRLKLSTHETRTGKFAKQNQYIGIQQAKIFLTEGVPFEIVREAVMLRGLKLDEIESWVVPKFPIDGSELLERFQGSALGTELHRLRRIWYQVDFDEHELRSIMAAELLSVEHSQKQ